MSSKQEHQPLEGPAAAAQEQAAAQAGEKPAEPPTAQDRQGETAAPPPAEEAAGESMGEKPAMQPPDGEAAAPVTLPQEVSIADAAPPESGGLLPFPTVAIGASAGGVDALRRLFSAMPPDTGCAFIVVMHLDPQRESMLGPLLGRLTAMPVLQVEDGMAVQANTVYVAPPGGYLQMLHGRLQRVSMTHRPPRPKAVDHLMMSLAQDQRAQAIGIVLSGTDGDGAMGVKAIKGEGGITIAQTPESAAHAGMPLSAVATGMIDRQLPVEEMPKLLASYVRHTLHGSAPAAALPDGQAPAAAPAAPQEPLAEVLAQVRAACGLDFRGYKTPMLLRRVQRRMGLASMDSVAAYLAYLRSSQKEALALAGDFLITVTEFFREPAAWVALAEDVLPRILARKQQGDPLRAWVAGCATGEEAYTLAMILLEQPQVQALGLKVQVFATDVDREALDVARLGVYGHTLENSVSPARLERFFSGEKLGGWQVRKELRDVVIFAPHNVLADPPFSRMDLVSCRNLLIYLEPSLQRRVLESFHFALVADGYLFLGKSETVTPLDSHFEPVSQASRIYRRTGPARIAARLVHPTPQMEVGARPSSPSPSLRAQADYGKLVRDALLEQQVSAAVLVRRNGQVLYVYGSAPSYLQQPQGVPTADLFPMLREELRPQVRAALHESAVSRHRVEDRIKLKAGPDAGEAVRLVVAPLSVEGDELLLVSFERQPGQAGEEESAGGLPDGEWPALRALEEELSSSKLALRTAVEELEAANEELKVANEEATSVNEELQSSNEELETSKEELQSVNEELTTVNQELQEKVAELERSNDDLGNLLSSTHIPTLFLDRQLHIRRYTPTATRLFSLIPGDVGRPLSDIKARCDMEALLHDAQRVLAELAPLSSKIRTDRDEHFLRCTLPYRTQDNRIEGVVITFVEITELERANEGPRRFATVMQGSGDAIIVHDPGGRVLAWNRGAQLMYGYAESEALNANMSTLLPEEAREAYAEQVQRALAGELVQGLQTRRRRRDGSVIDVSASLSPVRADGGPADGVALIERDITAEKRAEAALRESEQRFRQLADSAPVMIWMSDEQGLVQFVNAQFSAALGLPASVLQGRLWTELLHPDDIGRAQAAASAAGREAGGRIETTARLVHEGQARWMKVVAMPRLAGEPGPAGHVGCMVDIDAQVRAENTLRDADRRKDEFLAMLGHELRNPLAPIRNAAELLNRVAGDDPRIGWVSQTLVRQVSHVTRLVDDLLDISRITHGTMNLRREPLDLGFVIASAVDSVRPLFERKRHRFSSRIPSEPLWVEGDSIRLNQVFENLLTNAAKYTDEGGKVAIELHSEDGQAVVDVRDNGMGIAEGMQGRVFELFVQDERSVDRSQGGLGIGLALVKHLVELHHGVVEAHSEGRGRGSDFVVRLPLLDRAEVPAPERPSVQADARSGRVMIVDDDPESSESLAMVLQLSGFAVSQAHDLESALATAARTEPEAVVMDLAMPGADGYEVMRRMKLLPECARTCFVALSGFGSLEDKARSLQAGFKHHFVKPVNPVELERALQALILPASPTGA